MEDPPTPTTSTKESKEPTDSTVSLDRGTAPAGFQPTESYVQCTFHVEGQQVGAVFDLPAALTVGQVAEAMTATVG
eukprot:COSAG01_NODE_3577_length_5914_cov_24.715268_6_plen_76_part_00